MSNVHSICAHNDTIRGLKTRNVLGTLLFLMLKARAGSIILSDFIFTFIYLSFHFDNVY